MSKPRKSFTTKNGLEIPIVDLKGKEYILAADRVHWFRNENPNGVLKSTMLALAGEGQDEYCIFSAEVYIKTESGMMCVAQAHKRESRRDFPDFIEKCQTSAYARALALAGYGVQFSADEMYEGDRLADAPLAPPVKALAPVLSPEIVSNAVSRSSFRKPVAVVAKNANDDGI